MSSVSRLKNFIITMVSLCPFFSYADNYTVYDHIVITQEISVSAHRLCQDGLFVYFKSVQDCENSKKPFSCHEDTLMVAPINLVEKIYTEPGGESLTQFFNIQLSYNTKTFSVREKGEDKLILKSRRVLPFCKGREIHKTENVGRWRYAIDSEEKSLVRSLIDSKITLLNTPHGKLPNFDNVAFLRASLMKSGKGAPVFRSPLCNQEVPKDYIHKLSGEYSGNGIQSFQIRELQKLSTPMYIEKTRYIVDPVTNQKRAVHDFTCVPTWEI